MSKNPLTDLIPSDAPALAVGQWIPSGFFRADGTFCPTVELVNANPRAHTVSGKCAVAIVEDVDTFVKAVRAACSDENRKRVKERQAARAAKKGGETAKDTAIRKASPLAGLNMGD